jgi:four helix bundle protein
MNNENLKARTKRFALDVIKLVETLPPGKTCDVIGRQLLRSGTSVGANYRAACRAKSPADFVYKMGIVEEEADESGYWMELLIDSGKIKSSQPAALIKESSELVAISIASIQTARKNTARTSAPRASQIPHSALRTPH